jgi:hypothetical protein
VARVKPRPSSLKQHFTSRRSPGIPEALSTKLCLIRASHSSFASALRETRGREEYYADT